MKIAVSNLAWPLSDDAAVAKLLRREGVTGVELSPSKVWSSAPAVQAGAAEAYAAWWDSAKCVVVAFQAILYGRPDLTLFGDSEVVEATQRHLTEMGELAARCGARVLVLGAPSHRRRGARSLASALRSAAAVLRPVAESLEPHGVHLCVEPNPPQYGCDFVTTAAEAGMLAEAVGHPNFGVHLDAAALGLSGELTAGALQHVMKYVRHVHVSEVDLAPVGSGKREGHRAFADALNALNYDGWYSIEMLTTEDLRWSDALPLAIEVVRRDYYGQ